MNIKVGDKLIKYDWEKDYDIRIVKKINNSTTVLASPVYWNGEPMSHEVRTSLSGWALLPPEEERQILYLKKTINDSRTMISEIIHKLREVKPDETDKT
jgi:hypothetical protein